MKSDSTSQSILLIGLERSRDKNITVYKREERK